VPASEQDNFAYRGPEWTPDEATIAQLEKQLGLLFAHPDARVKGWLLTRDGSPPRVAPHPLSDYYIRYCGIIQDSTRLVIGKATHRSVADPRFVLRPPRQPGAAYVSEVTGGGGVNLFTATFDADKMNLVELSYNAPL
jgi:hypothetical protein